MPPMRRLACLLIALCACSGEAARLRLATTTSTENSGLLAELMPAFTAATGIEVDVVSMGTGKALATARNGDCDLLLVHAPAAEREFVAAGHGIERTPVMQNDFVLLGPPLDPARVDGMHEAAEALRRIAGAGAPFCSRGDESGTHIKEKELWAAAGMQPSGSWYRSLGQGMGQTLTVADELHAYVLADRGTFLSRRGRLELQVLVQGDPLLRNPYHAIVVNPARHPHTQVANARRLVGWLTGPEGQRRIADFEVSGRRLYHPVARAEPSWTEVQPLPSPPLPERGGLYRAGLSTAVRLLFSLDERVLDAARVSLLCSLAALLLAMLAGVPLALSCGRDPGRAGRVFLVLARTGMAVPTVVIGLLLYGIFSRAGTFGGLGVLYSPAAIIIGEFFLALPIVIALGAEAFAALDWRTERTARTLGAGPMRVRWTLLREAGPGVLAAHLAAFGRVISELGIAVMLGANIAGHTRTMTTTIAMETQKGMFGLGLAVGFLLLLIALALNLLAALGRSRAV